MAEVEALRAKYEKRKALKSPHTVTVVRLSPAQDAARLFVRDNNLSEQQAFDLARVIKLARDEGRKERKQERP